MPKKHKFRPVCRGSRCKKVSRKGKGFNVGDILVSTWGYGQSNVDFYKVVSTSAAMVTIQELKTKKVGKQGVMHSDVVPIKNKVVGKKMRKKQMYLKSGKPYLSMGNGYAMATLWDGNPEFSSWWN